MYFLYRHIRKKANIYILAHQDFAYSKHSLFCSLTEVFKFNLMTENRLNKSLWTDINKLKLLTKLDAPVRYLLTKSPFDEIDGEDETNATITSKDIIITGRIFPNSEIYKDGSYEIEMRLTSYFPINSPEVRFLTPIYHPNVSKDGEFCYELLENMKMWASHRSLVDVVTCVVNYIDKPNMDYTFSFDICMEYMQNKSVFDRKAMEYVKKYALPRF